MSPRDVAFALAVLGIALFVAAAAIGPFFSHPDYASLSHSVSQLAGQDMPNAWIMRGGFAAFGAGILAASLLRLRDQPAVFGALALFAASMLAAAIWSNLPIPPLTSGSKAEDDLHSIAASTMGAAFAAACAARLWLRRGRGLDRLSALGLAASLVLPLIMLLMPQIAGGAQRLMFLVSFVWILTVFSERRGEAAG